MKNKITAIRKTTESQVSVVIEKGAVKKDYRSKIRTPLPFLNHMIEHIVWRAGLNIDINLELPDFQLVHLVTEDVSMTLGKAVGEFVNGEQVEGIPAEELITFLDGFVQGARCTLHIDIEKGENGHHIWEAVYRAFGIALGAALSVDKDRENLTSGVAGEVTYEVTAE